MKPTTLIAVAVVPLAMTGSVWAAEKSPYIAPDGSWISLSGKAVEVGADSFSLDYGKGIVTVEMDDWDWYEENGEVLEGDKVTVYGEVDDDTYETAKIEASSVYVENLGTYFYASAADEETLDDYDLSPVVPIELGDITLTGTITSVDGREFTIDSGVQEMTVDTDTMAYNPMDDQGFQQLDKGDEVTVYGNTEDDIFEAREVKAETIVTLDDDAQSS